MSAPPPPPDQPHAGVVVLGNALEFYSFLIFSTFAVQIGAAYFPDSDPADSLLLTLATYGVGFLARPLGGVVIGTLGDTWGRRPTIVLSLVMMGLGTLGLALTPSTARIGALAPVLVVLFRLLQGFALGGEVGPVTAFLLEAAPLRRRCQYVSLQAVSQYVATLCASLAGLALTTLLPADAVAMWGWRVALLAGCAAMPVALLVRRRAGETFHESAVVDNVETTGQLLWVGLLGVCMVAGATIVSYTTSYLAVFLQHTLHRAPGIVLAAGVTTSLLAITGALVGGWLGDRLGRKPAMIGGSLLLLALTPLCFSAMAQSASIPASVLAPGALGFGLGLYVPAVLTCMAESLPINLRAGSLGIIYALAASSFGGTAQFAISWLVSITGSPLAPAWYMSGALLVGLVGMALIKETAPARDSSPS